MPLRQGGCEEWESGWRRRFCKGGILPRFRLQTHDGSTFLGLNTPILHVHIIAQVRRAASFVYLPTVSFRG
jgi:hypothetical protein